MFSYTSPNLTWAQLRHLSSRATLSVEIIAAAAVVLLASASTLANAAENPARLAREKHACAVVPGPDPSGAAIACASVASIKAYRNWIRRGWRRGWMRANEAHVPRRGSPPVRQLSQSVW